MMPKRFLFLSIILILPAYIFAQQHLEIKGTGDQLYLDHTVAPKESFYSIGRLYNVSPRDLAAYNHLAMDKGLNIGQDIKIPLNRDNFTQSTSRSAAEALVPVYHTVAPGETLYRLGVNYKNVPLDNIRKWNQLQGDNVNQGAPMIVGFLRVNKAESALAAQDFKPVGNAVASAKTETRRPEPVTVAKPQAQTSVETSGSTAPESNLPETPTPVIKTASSGGVKEGFFKSEFGAAGKTPHTVTGAASVFKSTSGWQDAKYYCFNNDAAPGSIIRISAPGTSRAIYAKVLDAIPDIKQNEGLALVLSNAAADALGINGDKFEATIQYF